MMKVEVSKDKHLADRFIKRNSYMLDEIALKTEYITKNVVGRGERRKVSKASWKRK